MQPNNLISYGKVPKALLCVTNQLRLVVVIDRTFWSCLCKFCIVNRLRLCTKNTEGQDP